MSQHDENQKPALNSQYGLCGDLINYNGDNFVAMIDRQASGIQGNGRAADDVEILVFWIRRYDGLGPERVVPITDRVVFHDEGIEKTFVVSGMGRSAESRIEWHVTASRTMEVRKGSGSSRPIGNRF